METTKVYVNDSLVVLYGEWPVEPTTVIIKTPRVMGGKTINHTLRQNYQKALKKAIAEAVPFGNQDEIKRIILNVYEPEKCTLSWCDGKSKIPGTTGCFNQCTKYKSIQPGFYEVDGLEWHSWHWINPCTKLCDCQLTGDEYRRACYEGCKKQYRVARAVIKPLSYGEKEEQKRTISSVCRAWTKRDIVQLTIKDMENFEASKLSSGDTNIEEKKNEESKCTYPKCQCAGFFHCGGTGIKPEIKFTPKL